MAILTDGIDLAKNVFTVHGVNEPGRPALRLPYGILRHLTNEGDFPVPNQLHGGERQQVPRWGCESHRLIWSLNC
jgi:hypothetical protein